MGSILKLIENEMGNICLIKIERSFFNMDPQQMKH